MMRTRLQALLSGLRRLADAIYRHPDPRTGILEPNPKSVMHVCALGSRKLLFSIYDPKSIPSAPRSAD